MLKLFLDHHSEPLEHRADIVSVLVPYQLKPRTGKHTRVQHATLPSVLFFTILPVTFDRRGDRKVQKYNTAKVLTAQCRALRLESTLSAC